MDTTAIRAQLQELMQRHIPSNAHNCRYLIYDGHPNVSALGHQIDPKPFSGKVIALSDEAVFVKTGRTQFAVLDRALVTELPQEGTKVQVAPYARRRFDGQRADAPEERNETCANGRRYTVQSFTLGGAALKLPVAQPRCPELQTLVTMLEEFRAPDGFRRIAHMLVDAGARDFSCVDPEPQDIIRTPPAISFTVATAKFSGRVSVLYERGPGLYALELHHGSELVKRVDRVCVDSLGKTLESLIDDGSWQRIHVQRLPASTRLRH